MKYSIIAVSGADRRNFLQGQMTQDLDRLPAETTLLAAWCNPKGRVLITCRLIERRERILLVIPAASVETTLKRLTMYRLRAAVHAELDSSLAAFAFADRHLAALRQDDIATAELPGSGVVEVVGSHAAIRHAQVNIEDALSDDAWGAARIAAGLVDIDVTNAEKYTPHMINLDLCGAVSFDKGCYTGQEIVARTEHLGKVKRRVGRYRLDANTADVGDRLSLDDKDVGEIVNVSGDDILALVPIAAYADTLMFGDRRAVPMPLPYSVT